MSDDSDESMRADHAQQAVINAVLALMGGASQSMIRDYLRANHPGWEHRLVVERIGNPAREIFFVR